jgi:hypothetical protein
MINDTVVDFFSDVVRHEGFILSADTCNYTHIGPKLAPFVRELNPRAWIKWADNWPNHRWGNDVYIDRDACMELHEALEACTEWAYSNVPGMSSETHIYQFGYSDYDGALLGWFRYPIEE